MKFVIIIITTLFLISGCGDLNQELNKENKEEITTEIQVSWEERLYSPTHVTKIEEKYFIVDAWHHRIIYSDDINLAIDEWNVLDDQLGGAHSIATDGEILVVDNTGFHKVSVYARGKNGEYQLVQEIDEIGNRPHRVIYSPEMDGFYVLGSVSTDIYFFKNVDGKLHLEFGKELEFLEGMYTRSFQIIDNKMYFVSGPNKIVVANYMDSSFEVLEEYDVPIEVAGQYNMNDIYKIDDYYYITSTPEIFVRTRDLSGLSNGLYENLYTQLGLKGTPYYIEKVADIIYLPFVALPPELAKNKHSESSGVLRIKVDNDTLEVEELHYFEKPIEESIIRKSENPT